MLKILTQLLEAGKITEDVAKEINGDISPEFSKLRDESASWRVKYQDLNKSYESVSKAKDELESKLGSFDEQIIKAKEDGKSELVKELEAQKSRLQETQATLEAISKQNKELKIETALKSSLSKFDVVDTDLVENYLKNLVALDGDNLKFKDGENVLSLDEGLSKFFESKPNLLNPKGNSGSGTDNGGTSFKDKSFSELSLDEKTELYKKDKALYEKLKGGN